MKPPLLVHGAHLERLRTDWQDAYDVRLLRDFPDVESFLRGIGAEIEVVVSDGHGPDAQLLAAMPRLRLVACFSTGHEGIDTTLLADAIAEHERLGRLMLIAAIVAPEPECLGVLAFAP